MAATPVDALLEERDKLIRGLVAHNTQVGYGYDWRTFERWAREMQRDPLPATAETVSLFITDQLGRGKKVLTATRRLSAIRHKHVSQGLPSPVTPEVRALLHGAARLRNEQPRQVAPLTLQQLRAIAELLNEERTEASIRNRAILLVGFASALRRSSIGALHVDDVEVDDRGVIIKVRKEKQDQEGRGRLIGLPRGKHVATCPVRALNAWLKVRGWAPGPLFTRLDYGRRRDLLPLRGEAIGRIVKACVRRIGLDARLYGGHSLRAGFITEAAEHGASELLIADQTGHRSMGVLRRYFRRSQLFKSNACAVLEL